LAEDIHLFGEERADDGRVIQVIHPQVPSHHLGQLSSRRMALGREHFWHCSDLDAKHPFGAATN
jgi:hypothetical protein